MQKSPRLNKPDDLSPLKWILGSLTTITLFFQTTLADPFNSPKLWVLIFFAAWLSGYVLSYRKIISATKPIRFLTYIVILFSGILILATIFTDFHYVAVFGDTQRRNGFLQYLSLSIILIASSMFVRIFNAKKLFLVTYVVALLLSIYSLMQTTGNDFVSWNNPYNAIIATLGNPNFAAAAMAIMGVMAFSSVFITTFNYSQRIFAALLVLLLLFVIYKSNARQGLLAYALGTGLFLTIWLYTKNRKIGILATTIGAAIFIISVLGMLQTGPFSKFLYKPSVSIRGYYWRAGLEMLANHPFTGVGIDRYGAYFKEYREVNYPLTYGFEITSSNAHNTFIQFFATGGFFLGLVYLVLNGYILKRAIYGIKNLSGNSRLLIAGVFSAWVAFQAQSLISIDNIGISIWGWVLGGSIVGLSISAGEQTDVSEMYPQRKKNDFNLTQTITSGLATLLAVTLIAALYQGESNSYKGGESVNLQDPASRSYFRDLQMKVIDTPLNDPNYKLFAASRLIQGGFIDEGLAEVEKINYQNPRNLDSIILIAETYEQIGNFSKAIAYREKLVDLDPWNATNYLELGKYYKAVGDLNKSQKMLDKILSFVPNGPITEQAIKELVT